MYNFFSLTILFTLIAVSFFYSLLGKLPIIVAFTFSAPPLILFLILHKIRLHTSQKLRGEFEAIEERSNLLKESIRKQKEILNVLPQKTERASFLFNVSQGLIETVEPGHAFDFLVSTSSDLFPGADNTSLFLLQDQSLKLIRSFSKQEPPTKGSEADIMDKWVLRHNLSLLVEDLAEDFRFDCTKVAAFRERNIRSVMVSPLSVGEKVKGTMKVESKAPSGFSLDDSRILRSICDLGAVVLERADLFQKAQDLAIRDALTSLFLREHFLVRLKEEIGQAYLTGTRIGILMLDIDDFKSINDTYGHVVGDLVLKKLAMVLSEVAGDTNSSLCRFGGEEFILFIVGCTRDGLYEVGKRIRKKVHKSIVSFRRKHISFTVSLGGVLFPEDGHDPIGLIDRADQLLYKAKREGKNRLCLP